MTEEQEQTIIVPEWAQIFNSEIEAKAFNNNEAIKRGCTGSTQYWFPMYAHPTETTTLTKVQYAELYNIPAQITTFDEETQEEVTIDNPKYVELESSITVPKWVVEVTLTQK